MGENDDLIRRAEHAASSEFADDYSTEDLRKLVVELADQLKSKSALNSVSGQAQETDWSELGRLIERERLVVCWADEGEWLAAISNGIDPGGDVILRDGQWTGQGPTVLHAATQAYLDAQSKHKG